MDILGALKWPLKAIDAKLAEQVADKARVATQAAIKELPDVVEDLLNGKPVELVIVLQLQSKK